MILREEKPPFHERNRTLLLSAGSADLLARRLRDDPKAAQRPALKAGMKHLWEAILCGRKSLPCCASGMDCIRKRLIAG